MQLGVGEVVGNPLAQALEQAVRSHGEGDVVELEITGGPYKPELLFSVPTDHPEIARLQGRYKSCALPPCMHAASSVRNAARCLHWAPVIVVLRREHSWRSACRQGGLEVGKVVELQNGGLAKVLSIDDAVVKLDANNMLAGLERIITVEVLKIERPDLNES